MDNEVRNLILGITIFLVVVLFAGWLGEKNPNHYPTRASGSYLQEAASDLGSW